MECIPMVVLKYNESLDNQRNARRICAPQSLVGVNWVQCSNRYCAQIHTVKFRGLLGASWFAQAIESHL